MCRWEQPVSKFVQYMRKWRAARSYGIQRVNLLFWDKSWLANDFPEISARPRGRRRTKKRLSVFFFFFSFPLSSHLLFSHTVALLRVPDAWCDAQLFRRNRRASRPEFIVADTFTPRAGAGSTARLESLYFQLPLKRSRPAGETDGQEDEHKTTTTTTERIFMTSHSVSIFFIFSLISISVNLDWVINYRNTSAIYSLSTWPLETFSLSSKWIKTMSYQFPVSFFFGMFAILLEKQQERESHICKVEESFSLSLSFSLCFIRPSLNPQDSVVLTLVWSAAASRAASGPLHQVNALVTRASQRAPCSLFFLHLFLLTSSLATEPRLLYDIHLSLILSFLIAQVRAILIGWQEGVILGVIGRWEHDPSWAECWLRPWSRARHLSWDRGFSQINRKVYRRK